MGLFKSMKDLGQLTKQAKELQRQQQQEAGYEPGMKGQFAQMGDMLEQANQQLGEFMDQSSDSKRIVAEGIAGSAVIVGMGTPARGARQYNLDLDLEVHVPGRDPYRVANQYIVPASAALGPGVTLSVKVDPSDPAKVAIDWSNIASGPARGQVRPAGGGQAPTAAPAPTPTASADSGGEDSLAQLERLAKLRDSGALTDAEFEQQKARILGS